MEGPQHAHRLVQVAKYLQSGLLYGIEPVDLLYVGCFAAYTGSTASCPIVCVAGTFALSGSTFCAMCAPGMSNSVAQASACTPVQLGVSLHHNTLDVYYADLVFFNIVFACYLTVQIKCRLRWPWWVVPVMPCCLPSGKIQFRCRWGISVLSLRSRHLRQHCAVHCMHTCTGRLFRHYCKLVLRMSHGVSTWPTLSTRLHNVQ